MNLNLTLIGQSLTFILFILFCMKYVWPVILGVMQEREQKIADGLNAAERADKDLELAQQEAVNRLSEAKAQAAEIIEQANKRASKIVEEAAVQAESEGERIKSSAQAEVDRQVSQAREELRGKLAELVITGAEKVLGSSVDSASHGEMLNKLSAEL